MLTCSMTIICWRIHWEHAGWKSHRCTDAASTVAVTSVCFLSLPTATTRCHLPLTRVWSPQLGLFLVSLLLYLTHFTQHYRGMAQIFIKYVYIYIRLLTQKLLSFCLSWAFTHYFHELAPNFLSGHVRPWLIRDHILSLCMYLPQITDMNSIHSLNLCFSLETYSTFLFPYVFSCCVLHLKYAP